MEQHPQENQSAKVLALGGLAAGVVGGLYVLLSERERKPESRVEAARHSLEEAADRARSQAKSSEKQLAKDLKEMRGRTKAKGKQSRKDIEKAAAHARKQARHEAEDAGKQLMSALEDARKTGSKRLKHLEKQAPDVQALAEEFRTKTEASLSKARATGARNAAKARKDAEKAQDDVKALLERTRKEAPKRLHDVESRVAPVVRDLEKQAAEAFGTGRERAMELRGRAEKDLLPEMKDTADRVLSRVEEQAKVASLKLEKGSSEAVHLLADATDSVESHAKDAGSAVAQGGRDMRSLVVWLALGGALVYEGFLNEEQRQKVNAWAHRMFGEASALYTDIKGEDGTFEKA